MTASADATDAWLPVSLSADCEMLASDEPAGTDGPTQRLASIMADINTTPTDGERVKLADQLARINEELTDIARHAPAEMASDFTALINFSTKLHDIFDGTSTETTFDMAEFKVPMLALLDMCTQ